MRGLCFSAQASHCGGFSCGARTLEHISVAVAYGLNCSEACGIFLDQGSNLCPLHWQADSYPLYHQGSPCLILNQNNALSLADLSENMVTNNNTCKLGYSIQISKISI